LNKPSFRSGILFVLSAPSGAGKTTLLASLRQVESYSYSVSCTTRPPRPGEVDGEHYHFLSKEEFERRCAAGEFLEHAEVHGRRYGTLCSSVKRQLEAGIDVLMDIDTQGAAQVRKCEDPVIRKAHVDVFLMPPSLEAIRERLRNRSTESDEEIELRIRNASLEIADWHLFQYTILSGTPEEDLARFRSIMAAERARTSRLTLNDQQVLV
jgi:guanylate kinase